MLVAVFSLIAVLLPLIEFVSDLLENPACFKIDVVEQRPIDYESIEVRITISYCSEIPLKEVRIYIGDREILFGSIARGEHVKEVAVSRKELEKGLKKIEFTIAGLYRLGFSALVSIYTGFLPLPHLVSPVFLSGFHRAWECSGSILIEYITIFQ